MRRRREELILQPARLLREPDSLLLAFQELHPLVGEAALSLHLLAESRLRGLLADDPRSHPRELQVRADAGEQLAGREGLHQVIVGAGLQPLARRLVPCPSGQEDDRDVLRRLVRAERAEQLEAGQPRHHDVAQDEVGLLRLRDPQRRDPLPRRHDLEGAAEDARDVVTQVRVIVDEEDAPARRLAPQ